MTLSTPPARQRDVAAALADPARVERARADHTRALARLATQAQAAVDAGATWAEIRAVVERAAAEHAAASQLAANARARVHGGDDTF